MYQMGWYQPLPASEKCQVHNGCECIGKLQNERLEDQPFLKTFVRFWDLWWDENISNVNVLHSQHEWKAQPTATRRTENSEPARDSSVDFVHDDDDDEVDNSCGGFDGGSYVSSERGGGAHKQRGLNWDPVQHHTEHDGQRNEDLSRKHTARQYLVFVN